MAKRLARYRLLLIWLGFSLLVAADWAAAVALRDTSTRLSGTPNWLDGLIVLAAAVLAGRWLAPAAERVSQRRLVRWAAVLLLAATCAWLLPWLLVSSLSRMPAGMLHDFFALPFQLKPLIVEPYRDGLPGSSVLALTTALLALLGLALTIGAMSGRVAWDALSRRPEQRTTLRDLGLVWLSAAYVVALDGFAAMLAGGTSNMRDGLVFGLWAVLAGRWLARPAAWLARHWLGRWAAVGLPALLLIWLFPWMFQSYPFGMFANGPLQPLFELPYQLKPAIIGAYHSVAASPPMVVLLAIGLSLGFGLLLLVLAACGRVAWGIATATAERRRLSRRFVLVWLGGGLVSAWTLALGSALAAGGNIWPYVAVMLIWAALVGAWLDPLAAAIERRPVLRWLALLPLAGLLGLLWYYAQWRPIVIVVGGVALATLLLDPLPGWAERRLVMPWRVLAGLLAALTLALLWSFARGISIDQSLLTLLAFVLVLNLAALAWRLIWRLLLRLRPVAWLVNGYRRALGWAASRLQQAWQRAFPPIHRRWTDLNRTSIWRRLLRGLALLLALLLVVNGVGVALALRPPQADWAITPTYGLPASSVLNFHALAATPDGQHVFAGTANGVYRSDDGGDTWQASNQGLDYPDVSALIVLGDGRRVFAGTANGVYRSDDGGASWQLAMLPELEQARFVHDLDQTPDGRSLFALTTIGLYRSDDSGASWRRIMSSLDQIFMEQIAVAADGQRLFGWRGAEVYRSDDGGVSWQTLTQTLDGRSVSDIAVAADGQTLFASTTDGIFRSFDGGAAWERIKPDPDGSVFQPLALAADGRHVFVASYTRLYRSDDAGRTWQLSELGQGGIGLLFVSPAGRQLFAVTFNGEVFRSRDGGLTWQLARLAPASLAISSLVIPAEGRRMFASNSGALYYSDDSGATWLAGAKLPENGFLYRVSAAAGGERLFAIAQGRLYRSEDGGDAWQPAIQPAEAGRLSAVLVLPDGQHVFASDEQGKAYRSENAGASWQPIAALDERYVYAFVATPDRQYVYAASFSGVYRSEDGGARWQSASQGLPGGLYSFALALTPDGQRIFAGTDTGVYYSDDRGNSWQSTTQSLGATLVYALAITPDGRRVFAGTNSGVYRSDDGGASWQSASQGLGNRYIRQLALAPDGRQLFAGTLDGVYRSDDGVSWQSASQGLFGAAVSLYVDVSGQGLLLHINNGGLFRLGGDMRWAPVADSDDTAQAQGGIPFAQCGVATFTPYRAEICDGKVSLHDPAYGTVPLARYHGPDPQALILHGDTVSLYAPGSGVALRTISLPLPQLIRPQGAYWSMVAWSWRRLQWLGANAGLLAVGPGLLLALALSYAYAGIARPNRLRGRTFAWLLGRPRYLLASAGYRAYAERAAAADPLEQLVLLRAPLDQPFAPQQIDADLRQLGAASSAPALQSAAYTLTQRGLLIREAGAWRLADPMLAEVHRREQALGALPQLAEQTRQAHPLFAEARRFLAQAGFTTVPADPFGLIATSDLPLWADVAPLYVRVVLNRELDLAEFGALCQAAQAGYGAGLRGRTAAVVIDRPPRAGDLYQIFALRAQEGLTIVPLPSSLIGQARVAGREIEALKEQIDLYAGRTDLYDMRAAVTDVLSFFGRSSLLADLQRRLTGGRSVAVFGLRKIGKSSLMGRLREECDWPVASVNIEEYVGGFGYVYTEALNGWRAALAASEPELALPAPPAGLDAPDPSVQAQAFRQAAGELLDLLATLPKRPGLLLFVDEIDILFGQPAYPDFAAVLRGLAENPRWRGRFAVLVAGLDPLLNRADRMDGQRNPFYSFFGELPLAPLDPADARTMIVSLGGQMGLSYDDAALDMLAEAGGGHPFLTRQLCSQAARDLDRPAVVSAERAEQAIDAYLRLARNYMAESLWGMESGGPPAADAALLQLLAVAPQPDEVLLAAELPPDQRRARQLALDRLHDQSLIRQGLSGWELTIPLYRRWIARYILALPARPAS